MTRNYSKGYGYGPIICGLCGQPARDHQLADFCHMRLYPNQPTAAGTARCDWCGHEYRQRNGAHRFCSHQCCGLASRHRQ